METWSEASRGGCERSEQEGGERSEGAVAGGGRWLQVGWGDRGRRRRPLVAGAVELAWRPPKAAVSYRGGRGRRIVLLRRFLVVRGRWPPKAAVGRRKSRPPKAAVGVGRRWKSWPLSGCSRPEQMRHHLVVQLSGKPTGRVPGARFWGASFIGRLLGIAHLVAQVSGQPNETSSDLEGSQLVAQATGQPKNEMGSRQLDVDSAQRIGIGFFFHRVHIQNATYLFNAVIVCCGSAAAG